MSADEGGLGAERLAMLRSAALDGASVWDGYTWRPSDLEVARADTRMLIATYSPVARFCMAFDPPTVLALLDEVERLTRERDEARARVAAVRAGISEAIRHEVRDRVKNDPPAPLNEDEKKGWRLGMTYAAQIARDFPAAALDTAPASPTTDQRHASFWSSPVGHPGKREDCHICPPSEAPTTDQRIPGPDS